MATKPRGRGRSTWTTRISEERIAAITCQLGTFALYLKYNDEDLEISPNITMVSSQGKRRQAYWNLSALTTEELQCFTEFIQLALELAVEPVEMRDKEAAEALAAGDDSHSRIFRQRPVFSVRPARRKATNSLRAAMHNKIVDKLETYKERIMVNINDLKEPAEDYDFGGPDEYAGEDAEDAEVNLPLEK